MGLLQVYKDLFFARPSIFFFLLHLLFSHYLRHRLPLPTLPSTLPSTLITSSCSSVSLLPSSPSTLSIIAFNTHRLHPSPSSIGIIITQLSSITFSFCLFLSQQLPTLCIFSFLFSTIPLSFCLPARRGCLAIPPGTPTRRLVERVKVPVPEGPRSVTFVPSTAH